jgi:tetratricopeptide (TPR) repeat protein
MPLPSAMPTEVALTTETVAPPSLPTVAPTEVVEAVVAEGTRPDRVLLDMQHVYQRRNNCAPATTSMVLGVHALYKDQFEIAAIQKPVLNDVNVTAEEVAVSIRLLGMGAYVGINGDIDLLERLLWAGFAVMTEEWMPYEEGGVGHFRAIRGYDQSDGTIYYNDSFYGGELWRSYKSLWRDWAAFNYKFIVPYPLEREVELQQIIGANWHQATMYENLRLTTQQRVEQEPTDSYAWWGLGEALLWQGQAEEALAAFEQGLANGSLPAHYLWYRYGYFDALNRIGRHEEVLTLTLQPLNEMGRSEDLRYHRAVAMNGLGRIEDAKAELQQALLDNPDFIPAKVLLEQLKG